MTEIFDFLLGSRAGLWTILIVVGLYLIVEFVLDILHEFVVERIKARRKKKDD